MCLATIRIVRTQTIVTLTLPQGLINEIRNQAYASPYHEICGFVLDDRIVYPCQNISDNPSEFAVIGANDFAIAASKGEITHHYHSHVNDNPEFSVEDVKTCKSQLRIPWILCHAPTGHIEIFDPNNRPPLIGRHWRWSHQNCYSIVQDYYKDLGIELEDFYLESPESWKTKSVGYLENIESQGFVRIEKRDQVKNHDLALFWLGRTVAPNHIAVIVDASQNKMLHHVANAISTYAVFSCDKTLHSVWRHREIL